MVTGNGDSGASGAPPERLRASSGGDSSFSTPFQESAAPRASGEPSGRLWAPWRINYILGPKMTGCPFCSACALGPGPESLIVAQRPQAFVMLNRYPYVGGHLMVIPRVHVSRVTDLASETWDELSFLVRESIGRLEQTLHPGGVNMGMNQGEAAGAGIASHLHIHLVPRWAGDTNFMAVTAGTRVVSQGLEHAYTVLRPVFADLDDRY